MNVYGEEGYLYVMLCARYFSACGQKVLVADESEGRRVIGLLPLPPEQIDCLYYQGVDYFITGGLPAGTYDVTVHFHGSNKTDKGRGCGHPAVVFTDLGKASLQYALDLVLAKEAILVAVGVPKYGTLKFLLDRMEVGLQEGQFFELPWKCRDTKTLLALEYGIRVSPHKLSGAMVRLLRFLSSLAEKEGEARDYGFLEQCE